MLVFKWLNSPGSKHGFEAWGVIQNAGKTLVNCLGLSKKTYNLTNNHGGIIKITVFPLFGPPVAYSAVERNKSL
jgi:hypothetical protein